MANQAIQNIVRVIALVLVAPSVVLMGQAQSEPPLLWIQLVDSGTIYQECKPCIIPRNEWSWLHLSAEASSPGIVSISSSTFSYTSGVSEGGRIPIPAAGLMGGWMIVSVAGSFGSEQFVVLEGGPIAGATPGIIKVVHDEWLVVEGNDFGAGYSSINVQQSLAPPQRSFVDVAKHVQGFAQSRYREFAGASAVRITLDSHNVEGPFHPASSRVGNEIGDVSLSICSPCEERLEVISAGRPIQLVIFPETEFLVKTGELRHSLSSQDGIFGLGSGMTLGAKKDLPIPLQHQVETFIGFVDGHGTVRLRADGRVLAEWDAQDTNAWVFSAVGCSGVFSAELEGANRAELFRFGGDVPFRLSDTNDVVMSCT